MGKPASPDAALRAAKLSHVPGVTIAEACRRFGVTKAAVTKARRDPAARLSTGELALAALTRNGEATTGSTTGLDGVARWLAYVDKAEYSSDEVRALLAPFVARGQLVLGDATWTLAAPWP